MEYNATAAPAADLHSDSLIPAPEARRLLGISAMSEWRWRQEGLLPEPVKIRRRCYYRRGELLAAMRAFGEHA